MATNSAFPSYIVQNFNPVRDVMAVLATCENEEDPIKNGGARVLI